MLLSRRLHPQTLSNWRLIDLYDDFLLNARQQPRGDTKIIVKLYLEVLPLICIGLLMELKTSARRASKATPRIGGFGNTPNHANQIHGVTLPNAGALFAQFSVALSTAPVLIIFLRGLHSAVLLEHAVPRRGDAVIREIPPSSARDCSVVKFVTQLIGKHGVFEEATQRFALVLEFLIDTSRAADFNRPRSRTSLNQALRHRDRGFVVRMIGHLAHILGVLNRIVLPNHKQRPGQ